MQDIDWNLFKIKFKDRERVKFEELAYMLFCFEFEVRIGVFRFKNQVGIETEPIEKAGIKIAFQAKFFETPLAENKNDIIDSVNKAFAKNPGLNKLLLYTNKELSESSKPDTKEPTYKVDIEAAAEKLAITIEWRTLSHFEKMLSLPENDYLAEYFFSLGNGSIEFLENLQFHTNNILGSIHSDIRFQNEQVKIDRTRELHRLSQINSNIIIISGDGGSGKTALLKDWVSGHGGPLYLFKASEFFNSTTNDFFRRFGNLDLKAFLKLHNEETNKTFVIDSAEKLADLEDKNIIIEIVSALLSDKWQLIFTTRRSYLNDISFQMADIYRFPFEVFNLENLEKTQLKSLAEVNNFTLPTNTNLLSLIRNLFYLDQYLNCFNLIDTQTGITRFKAIIWEQKIMNAGFTKNNIHIERGNCLMRLARERSDTGSFFISNTACNPDTLSLLAGDDIIQFDSKQNLYFITHDIYEEWALERLIESEFKRRTANKDFFITIGQSLPVRRAFRNWLSDKLADSSQGITDFIDTAFVDDNIPEFWKDELLVSVMLSDYAGTFFFLFGDRLFEERILLYKIMYLLRTACKEPVPEKKQKAITSDNELVHFLTRPKGMGWQKLVEFFYTNISKVENSDLEFVASFMAEWLTHNPKGETSRMAGLFVLHFYKKAELNEDNADFSSSTKKSMLDALLAGAGELKVELTEITESILAQPFDRRKPYNKLRDKLIGAGPLLLPCLMTIPEQVIKLAEHSWLKAKDEDQRLPFASSGIGVESFYGLRSHVNHAYYPASGLQTPIYYLLYADLQKTVDFILRVVNKATENYLASGFDPTVLEIDVTIEKTQTRQIISAGIWMMYRGNGSPVTPNLLQSIHMALETRLLQLAKESDKTILKEWLIYLLKNTRSASITAVVTAIVLAYPDELFDIAEILFATPDFMACDSIRFNTEDKAKSLYMIANSSKNRVFSEERIASCDDPHRRKSLEGIALNYQFFKPAGMSDQDADTRTKKIWKIIDDIYSKIPDDEKESSRNQTLRLLLTRIDKRKMNPTVTKDNESMRIDFNPVFEQDLEALREEGQKKMDDRMKYSGVKLWATNIVEDHAKYGNYPQFDENPEAAFLQLKEVYEKFTADPPDPDFNLSHLEVTGYISAALLKKFGDQLSTEMQEYCRDWIIEYATSPLRENYRYQIGDGVEAAIGSLSILYKLFPEERYEFDSILLLILFDLHPIGEYKRVCDYSVETIKDNLSGNFPDHAKRIWMAYMQLIPLFEEQFLNNRKQKERKPRIAILEEFIATNKDALFQSGSDQDVYSSIDMNALNLRHIEIALQSIPDNTNDPVHLEFVKTVIARFIADILANSKYSDPIIEDDYKIKIRLRRKFAAFLLRRDVHTITAWIKPFVEAFTITHEMGDFLSDIVSEEDSLAEYDRFWIIWNEFYPAIKNAVSHYRHLDLDYIVRNYLLAWQWWKDTARDWRSLRPENAAFFKKVCLEMGHYPAVLTSITQFLNQVGSPFLDQGVGWVSGILSKHRDSIFKKMNPYTVLFLELICRKYVYLNRSMIKQNKALKDNLLVILNFLVLAGSVNGYMLREEIL